MTSLAIQSSTYSRGEIQGDEPELERGDHHLGRGGLQLRKVALAENDVIESEGSASGAEVRYTILKRLICYNNLYHTSRKKGFAIRSLIMISGATRNYDAV